MNNKFNAALKDIQDGISANPGRFALSIATISIGIMSLSILISVLNGLGKKSDAVIQNLGINVIGILNQNKNPMLPGSLQLKHARYLQDTLPNTIVTSLKAYDVATLGTHQTVKIIMTDTALLKVRQWKLHSGRFLDERDLLSRERNVVISRRLSETWNWSINNSIFLGRLTFNVVGIVEIGGSAIETELANSALAMGEHVAFVPNTLEPYWLTQKNKPIENVDAIFVYVNNSKDFSQTLIKTQQLLSHPDQQIGPVSWVTPETLLSGIKKLRDTLGVSIGSIAILSLFLGGATLMSLMIANVKERVTEIGLRRSLGATSQDIVTMFLLEAFLITVIAGLLGTALAQIILFIGKSVLPISLSLDFYSLLLPIIISVLFGMLFSYKPAKNAANINPAEALREI